MVVFALAVVMCFAALLPGCAKNQSADAAPAMTSLVYFLNSSTNTIVAEDRAVTGDTDPKKADSVLDAFLNGPKDKNLTKTCPDNLQILEAKLTDNTQSLMIDFSPEYHNMTPLQETFFRASFVLTMTALPFIDSVQIYVGGVKLTDSKGEPINLLTKDDFVLNPTISPIKTEIKTITLYFTNADGSALIPETRSVEVNPETDLAVYVMQELIAGPKADGSYPVLPPDVKAQDVKTEEGICYVSLSSDFLTKVPGGACLPNTTVYAIVDSLTELTGVAKVKFLVDSESVGLYRGAADLSKAVERDESLIQSSGQ